MTSSAARGPEHDDTTVTVGEITYTKRRYTPKRRGGPAGHGWMRAVVGASSASGLSEASAEVTALVNEVVRLRAALATTAAPGDDLVEVRCGDCGTKVDLPALAGRYVRYVARQASPPVAAPLGDTPSEGDWVQIGWAGAESGELEGPFDENDDLPEGHIVVDTERYDGETYRWTVDPREWSFRHEDGSNDLVNPWPVYGRRSDVPGEMEPVIGAGRLPDGRPFLAHEDTRPVQPSSVGEPETPESDQEVER